MGRKVSPRSLNFVRGLETTQGVRNEDPFLFPVFQNSRITSGNAKRRDGMVRLYRWAAPSVTMAFDGTNDLVHLPLDTRADFRSLPTFTVEILWKASSIAANRTVVGSASATACGLKITQTTTSTVTTVITDAGGASTTLTHTGVGADTVCAYQLTRNGATVTAKINGVVQTGTMSATNLLARTEALDLGADNGGTFFIGVIDFFRAFRVVKMDQHCGHARLVNPRAGSVIVDYVLEPDANGYVPDRGVMGINGRTSGSPAATSAPLAVNPMPVLGIALNRNNDQLRQAYIRVAGAIVPVKF